MLKKLPSEIQNDVGSIHIYPQLVQTYDPPLISLWSSLTKKKGFEL